MEQYNLKLLGLEIAFRTGVGKERVDSAKALVEERYDKLRSNGGRRSRELLLTFMVLGLADDLLHANKQVHDAEKRIGSLLTKIEEIT